MEFSPLKQLFNTARFEYRQLSATGNLSVDNNMSLDLGIRQNSATDVTSYSSGINWRFEKVQVSTRVGYDSNERWSGVISAAITLVHQPGTLLPRLDRRASVSSGSVEARVFEDVTDSERQPVEGANVSAPQNWLAHQTRCSCQHSQPPCLCRKLMPQHRHQPSYRLRSLTPHSRTHHRRTSGAWFVQIGAYDSRDKAQTTWDRFSEDMQTLQRKTARFMPFQSMTRLLVGPGGTRETASSICEQLKADNLDCLVRQVE